MCDNKRKLNFGVISLNNWHKKKTVLITGASTGIGYELAKLFAEDDYNLVLVARNLKKFNIVADELYRKFNANIKLIGKDLFIVSSAEKIYDELVNSNIEIDVLVNNAGAGVCGLFHETNYKKDMEIIHLNITSLTVLTKLICKSMVKRGKGKILNVASTGSYQPGPYIAVYYATKAYVLSFSQAISNELGDFGVKVTTLCPGATKTKFSSRAGKADIENAMDANKVAKIAYNGLKKNKKLVIPGTVNKAAVFFSKLIPGRISASMVRRIQQGLVERLEP